MVVCNDHAAGLDNQGTANDKLYIHYWFITTTGVEAMPGYHFIIIVQEDNVYLLLELDQPIIPYLAKKKICITGIINWLW